MRTKYTVDSHSLEPPVRTVLLAVEHGSGWKPWALLLHLSRVHSYVSTCRCSTSILTSLQPCLPLDSLAAEFTQGIGDTDSPDPLVMRQVFVNALTRGLMPVFSPYQVRGLESLGNNFADAGCQYMCASLQLLQGPPNSWHANVSGAAAAYSRVYSRFLDALLYGTTIRSPALVVSSLESWFTEKGVRMNVTLPAASVGAFRSATGSKITAMAIIASISDLPVDFELPLSFSGWSSGGVATLYDGATGSVLQEWPSAPNGVNSTIQEACGVRVLVLQDARVPPPRRGTQTIRNL